MEYLNTSLFTDVQLWIVEEKLKSSAYTKIKEEYIKNPNFAGTLSLEALKTFLKRSSLSLTWSKGCICGSIPLLKEVDVCALKEYALETAIDGSYIDVDDVIEKVNFLRKTRFSNARRFLVKINCFL